MTERQFGGLAIVSTAWGILTGLSTGSIAAGVLSGVAWWLAVLFDRVKIVP